MLQIARFDLVWEGVKLLYVLLAQRLVQGLPVIAKRGEAAAGVGLIAASGILLLKD